MLRANQFVIKLPETTLEVSISPPENPEEVIKWARAMLRDILDPLAEAKQADAITIFLVLLHQTIDKEFDLYLSKAHPDQVDAFNYLCSLAHRVIDNEFEFYLSKARRDLATAPDAVETRA